MRERKLPPLGDDDEQVPAVGGNLLLVLVEEGADSLAYLDETFLPPQQGLLVLVYEHQLGLLA